MIMRTLAITENLSADGSPEFLGDWFDPTESAPDLNAEVLRQSEQEDILLVGRQTLEDFRSYWTHQTDDTTGIELGIAALDDVHVDADRCGRAGCAGHRVLLRWMGGAVTPEA